MSLKTKWQEHIHIKNAKEYEDKLAKLVDEDPFKIYLREKEKDYSTGDFEASETEAAVCVFPDEAVTIIDLSRLQTEYEAIAKALRVISTKYVILIATKGRYRSNTMAKLVASAFNNNANTELVYGNEDEMYYDDAGLGIRINPWFKTKWSPDTFISFFYFGSFIAIKKESVLDMTIAKEAVTEDAIYEYLYRISFTILKKNGFVKEHKTEPVCIDTILFHRIVEKNACADYIPGASDYFVRVKKEWLNAMGYQVEFIKSSVPWGEQTYDIAYAYYINKPALISIIIPSKDHPEVLERCVSSLRQNTSYKEYEIIVVDNGSNAENKTLYEECARKYDFAYYYQPMEFNFSRMCNIGVSYSKGEYILLLNDDIEILPLAEYDWLSRLYSDCARAEVGTVGAKLLFPNSSLIQHSGITNMYAGPSHKMIYEEDRISHYHGRNYLNYNMVGVTAACLLVSREHYDANGGFNEELKVAFNDVAFNFGLDSNGLRNIIRNDVVLYHHESLSRGNDCQSKEKMQRLRDEWKKLYELYPKYYGYDPYYPKDLTGVNNTYTCWPVGTNYYVPVFTNVTGIKINWDRVCLNEFLTVYCDRAGLSRIQGEPINYIIDLRAFVSTLDSADYKYSIILKGQAGTYKVPYIRKYRPDVPKAYTSEKHIEMCGFVSKLAQGVLPDGEYEIFVMAKCLYSRQKLLNKANKKLIIDSKGIYTNKDE